MEKNDFPAHINQNKIQTCQDHCENTAKYARKDLESVGLDNAAYLAGLLHDCGKFTDEFREYILNAASGISVRKGSVIHTFAGVFCALQEKYHDMSSPYNALTAEITAYAVGAHHGLFDCINDDHENGFEHRLTKQPEYEEKAIENFIQDCCGKKKLDSLFQKAVTDVEAAVMKFPEIASSDDTIYNSEIFFYIGLLTRLIVSAVIDGDRRDTAEFMTAKEYGSCIQATPELWDRALYNVEKKLSTFQTETQIQKARREISNLCAEFAAGPSGVFRLNVPTGGGKTLSSLRYALEHAKKYEKKRIIYTAPLISILDQNAEVIRRAIDNDSIVLEHHSNIIHEEEGKNGEQLSKYDLLTETWDAPIIITTLVQLLNTFLSGRTSCVRRFHALCDSIIIIDEVQSVPENMLSLFNLTLNFLSKICNATILLCSATQPCLEEIRHKLLISDKSVIPEDVSKRYAKIFKRTELISKGNYKLHDLPSFVDEVLTTVNSVLIVCNTKGEAAELFKAIRLNNENSFHLSASMCMAHRKDVMDKLYASLKEGGKTVCVATQVIEAGVDISFEAVIRLTAGIDNIVQAAGRCNRNGENKAPSPVYIVRCIDEKLGNLDEIKNAQSATNNLIAAYEAAPERFASDLSSDESVRFYYFSLYHSFPENYCDYPVKDKPTLFNMLSDNGIFSEGSKGVEKYMMRQAFKTAGNLFQVFDPDSESVITPYGDGKGLINDLCLNMSRPKYDFMYLRELLQKAKQYSVSLNRNQLEKLQKAGAVEAVGDGRVMILKDEWYSKETGMTNEPEGKEADECNILIL